MTVTSVPPARTAMIALALAIVYIVWGSTYLAIRFAVETMPPLLMAGFRFVLAGALLYVLTRRQHAGPLTRSHWRSAIIIGTLLLLGGNGLVCWAEQYVPSGIAALLVATVPLWFVLLEWLVMRGGRPTIRVVIGIAAGWFGVFLLLGGGDAVSGTRVHLGGAAALVSACAFWSLGSLYSRRAELPKSAFLATAMEMCAGGVALLIAGTLLGEWSRFHPAAFSTKSLISFAYLFVVGSMIGLTAYVWLLQNCSPTIVSTYAFVNPIVAVSLGSLLAGEPFGLRTLLAMSVIVLGVVIITLTPKRLGSPTPTTPPATDPRESCDASPRLAAPASPPAAISCETMAQRCGGNQG